MDWFDAIELSSFCSFLIVLSLMLRRVSGRWFSSKPVGEPLRMKYVRNLPWFAQSNEIPSQWKWFGAAALAPLWAGAVAVHVIPGLEVGTPQEDQNDTSRQVMTWTLHYASSLLGAQAALHWGLEVIKFGLPTHTVEFTPLYRFVRFGLPVVPLAVAVLASRLSVENPQAASVVLMCLAAAGTTVDFFSYTFATSPVWFPRYQWYWALSVIGGLFVLMTSERMLIRGESPRINTE